MHALAKLGQLSLRTLAPKQVAAELVFEVPNGASERRLRHIAPFGSPGEIQLTGRRQEISDLLHFHTAVYHSIAKEAFEESAEDGCHHHGSRPAGSSEYATIGEDGRRTRHFTLWAPTSINGTVRPLSCSASDLLCIMAKSKRSCPLWVISRHWPMSSALALKVDIAERDSDVRGAG